MFKTLLTKKAIKPINGKMLAQMAELVDATDSKSVVRKDVQVRFLFWARFTNLKP